MRADRRTLRTKLAESETKRAEAEALAASIRDAGKAEVEAARKDATAQAEQRIVRAEIKAAAVKAGAHDPAALLKLLDTSKLTIGDDGEVVGVDDLLTAAKASMPWAFSGPSATGQPAGATTSSTARTPPAAPAGGKKAAEMTQDEWKAARAAMLARR